MFAVSPAGVSKEVAFVAVRPGVSGCPSRALVERQIQNQTVNVAGGRPRDEALDGQVDSEREGNDGPRSRGATGAR